MGQDQERCTREAGHLGWSRGVLTSRRLSGRRLENEQEMRVTIQTSAPLTSAGAASPRNFSAVEKAAAFPHVCEEVPGSATPLAQSEVFL